LKLLDNNGTKYVLHSSNNNHGKEVVEKRENAKEKRRETRKIEKRKQLNVVEKGEEKQEENKVN